MKKGKLPFLIWLLIPVQHQEGNFHFSRMMPDQVGIINIKLKLTRKDMKNTTKIFKAKVCLLGDFSKEILAHQAINQSFEIASQKYGASLSYEWVLTRDIGDNIPAQFSQYSAVWCTPGSPYENMDGVLKVLQFIRENQIPFLGTCGGYQYALVEYARNVLLILDADLSEVHPDAVHAIITPLACSLVEESEEITIAEQTLLHQIYGVMQSVEQYHCRFGFNAEYRSYFESDLFKFSAFNQGGEIRAFELTNHPFYIGTSFQPERASLNGVLHPIIKHFIQAALERMKLFAI